MNNRNDARFVLVDRKTRNCKIGQWPMIYRTRAQIQATVGPFARYYERLISTLTFVFLSLVDVDPPRIVLDS